MTIPLVMVGLPLVVAMALVCYRACRGDAVALAALCLLAAVWFRVDGRFEGRVLISVTPDHGLVVGDLVGLGAMAVGGVGWWLGRRRSRDRRRRDGRTTADADQIAGSR